MKTAAALPCTVCTDPSGAGCFVWGASCAELCHIVSILTVPLLISFMICGRSELFGSVWLSLTHLFHAFSIPVPSRLTVY